LTIIVPLWAWVDLQTLGRHDPKDAKCFIDTDGRRVFAGGDGRCLGSRRVPTTGHGAGASGGSANFGNPSVAIAGSLGLGVIAASAVAAAQKNSGTKTTIIVPSARDLTGQRLRTG